jgi:hypothetical protein
MRKNRLGLLILIAVILLITVLPATLPGCTPLGCGCTCAGTSAVDGDSESTTSIWVILGPGIVILLVAIGLAYYIGRRGR